MQFLPVLIWLWGHSTTCVCLLSTTWPPGRTAIITRSHGDRAIGTSERHGWREAGSERRLPAEPADTTSLKHKGDSWRWGRSSGRNQGRGVREPERHRDSFSLFAALSACLLAPFLGPLTLLSSPLILISDLSLFFISFVALTPSHSPLVSFCLAGIYLKMITPPPSPPPPTTSVPSWATFTPSSMSASLPLRESCVSSLLSIAIKMVAVETDLFGNGGRKMTPALCLSVLIPPRT